MRLFRRPQLVFENHELLAGAARRERLERRRQLAQLLFISRQVAPRHLDRRCVCFLFGNRLFDLVAQVARGPPRDDPGEVTVRNGREKLDFDLAAEPADLLHSGFDFRAALGGQSSALCYLGDRRFLVQ